MLFGRLLKCLMRLLVSSLRRFGRGSMRLVIWILVFWLVLFRLIIWVLLLRV